MTIQPLDLHVFITGAQLFYTTKHFALLIAGKYYRLTGHWQVFKNCDTKETVLMKLNMSVTTESIMISNVWVHLYEPFPHTAIISRCLHCK